MNVYKTLCRQEERSKLDDTPEELVLVLHELGFKKIDCGSTHAEPLQVSHEGGKERVVRIELYLACRRTRVPRVSVMDGPRRAKHGKKKKDSGSNMRTRTTYPGSQ